MFGSFQYRVVPHKSGNKTQTLTKTGTFIGPFGSNISVRAVRELVFVTIIMNVFQHWPNMVVYRRLVHRAPSVRLLHREQVDSAVSDALKLGLSRPEWHPRTTKLIAASSMVYYIAAFMLFLSPIRKHPVSVAIGAALLLVVALLRVERASANAIRLLHQRVPTQLCSCGYYVAHSSGICPECGEPIVQDRTH